jgi:hypothetical protein
MLSRRLLIDMLAIILLCELRRPDNARSFAALKLQVAAVQRPFDLDLVDFTTARVPAQPV